MQPSQTMTTYILVRHKKSYSISTISTPNHHSQRIASTYPSRLNFNTTTILPPVGKEYMCFMKEGKSDQASRHRWELPVLHYHQKKGKGKLPLFCGNVKRAIPIYTWRPGQIYLPS